MDYLARITLSMSLLLGSALIVPAYAQQNSTENQNKSSQYGSMPHRGMTMIEVEQHFGKPLKILAAVGNPPITRWNYDGFSVTFEYHYVIHALATAD